MGRRSHKDPRISVSGPFSFHDVKKIAVELPFGMGDQIMSFPLFASLKKANPGIHITVLSPNKNSSRILERNPNIDRVYEYGLKRFHYKDVALFFMKGFVSLWHLFFKERFDLFIIVHPNGFRTLLRWLLPALHVIQNRENTHKTREVENILRYLGIPAVYDYLLSEPENRIDLNKYGLKRRDYIALDLYSQYLEKDPRQWPYMEDLLKALVARKQKVVLVGINPRHEIRNDAVDLVNKTSLSELLEIIRHARLVVAMDTGLFHFSYSQKTPVLGLFGPVDPLERIPYDKNLIVDYLYTRADCSPCIVNRVDIPCRREEEPYKCTRDISVEAVLERVENLLGI